MPAIRSIQTNSIYCPTLFRPSSRPFRAARLRGHPWYRDYQPHPPSKLSMSILASDFGSSESSLSLSELDTNTDTDTDTDIDTDTDTDTDINSPFSTPTRALPLTYDTSPIFSPPTSPSVDDSDDDMSLVVDTPSRGSSIAQAQTQPATPSTPTPLPVKHSQNGLRRTYAMVISPLSGEPIEPSTPSSLFSYVVPDEDNNALLEPHGTSILSLFLFMLIVNRISTNS